MPGPSNVRVIKGEAHPSSAPVQFQKQALCPRGGCQQSCRRGNPKRRRCVCARKANMTRLLLLWSRWVKVGMCVLPCQPFTPFDTPPI
eukprot:scaffold57740_cov20-Tisochrysis_lutea.AAC.3